MITAKTTSLNPDIIKQGLVIWLFIGIIAVPENNVWFNQLTAGVTNETAPETHFYTPVFKRDVLWYGAVRPSVRPSVRLLARKNIDTNGGFFFKFGTQVCLGVPSIN